MGKIYERMAYQPSTIFTNEQKKTFNIKKIKVGGLENVYSVGYYKFQPSKQYELHNRFRKEIEPYLINNEVYY